VTRTFSSADGRFEWEYPPAGEWTLAATAAGYQRFELADLRLPVAEPAEDLVLLLRQALRVRGRVYDEDSGAAIADAQIMAHPIRGPHGSNQPLPATSLEDGKFTLDGLPAGRTTLSVWAPHYAQKTVEVVVGDDTPTVEIGLISGGAITGRLVAADGTTPVTGMIGLSNLDRGHGTGTNTSPTGAFEFDQLLPGRYQLIGHADGGMARREILVGRSQRIDGIILVLTAGHSIRGVVTGLRPDERARTRLYWNREGDGAAGGLTDIRIDNSGAFVIPGVPPGRVYIGADSESRQVSKTVEMPADSDVTVALDFPRGVRLSGRITRGGEPLSGVPIGPGPPPGLHPTVSVNGTTTGADGTYVIEDLPPGDYVLMIFPFASPRLTVAADTVFDFDVPAGQLTGRVLDARGDEPVAGAEVFIWPAEPGEARRPIPHGSDEGGRFTLFGLEPGEFMVTVYKPGYEMFRKRISYETKPVELNVQLREDRGVRVTARQAASGTPLKQLIAVEVIGAGRGSLLRLQMDDEGTGYLPSALSGSTLRFISMGCEPTTIDRWNGDPLELELKRAGTP
jgi:hypothetical protein